MWKIKIALLSLLLTTIIKVSAVPVLSFENKSAIKFERNLTVGEIEIIEFAQAVNLAHYGTTDQSLNYIELEKLEAQKDGYRKFIIKAKAAGSGELTFQSGADLIKIKVMVRSDYKILEDELNKLFGLNNNIEADRIKVISANLANSGNDTTHIYLKGKVKSAKDALLALSFAANALGDSGVKIYSNPGGQLRAKDLDNVLQQNTNKKDNNDSFAEYYDSINKLIDTDNLHRDLILASSNEKVISFIQIQEPKRFAVKVRFLEMNSQYIDKFISSLSMSGKGADLKGSIGSNDFNIATVNNNISDTKISDAVGGSGIGRLASEISSGNIVSGVSKLFDNTFLNVNLNDLLQEGLLRVVNEFALVTHSGDRVALGKGTRFPIPKLNNNVGNSSITVEYIPIGFKGELKVTELDNELIDVQMATRLSSAESSLNSISGLAIPIFNEEYVNSGALLKDGQEVVLNAFLTETETTSKASSLLSKIIPFIGNSKLKRKTKNLLFIAIKAEEIDPSSQQNIRADLHLPHIDINKSSNMTAVYSKELAANKINIDLADINGSNRRSKDNDHKIDPLELPTEGF
jgi:Flp pilus assembly secretin CpaC